VDSSSDEWLFLNGNGNSYFKRLFERALANISSMGEHHAKIIESMTFTIGKALLPLVRIAILC
jgi:hypothetical protein